MEKKQSSIDYFFEEVVKWQMKPWLYASDGLEPLFQQAKQMEKEQMIEFAEDYIDYHCYADFDNQITYDKTAEEYFNETYKGDYND